MARKNAQFCQSVRRKVESWREYFRENIENYYFWFNFVMGDQWEEGEADLLKKYKKRPLVMNKLSPLSKHILGEQRQNTPNLQSIPDENVDAMSYSVRDALLKHIMFSSDAKTVYQNSFQQALIGGFGAYIINSDYVSDKSFDQEPKINSVRDAAKTYFDISAETPNKTDGMHAGLVTRMSRESFRDTYGAKIESSIGENFGNVDTKFVWSNKDEITVIIHYQRKIIKDTLYELSNGETIYKKEFDESLQMIPSESFGSNDDDNEDMEVIIRDGEIVSIVKQRNINRDEIKIYKIAGDYILDESEFAADELGVVFVDQNSWFDKTGKQICTPYFKDAKDAQIYLNYIATMSAYIWKVARYDQYMASKANVKGKDTQAIWRDPATYQGALIYDLDLEGGTKPERLLPPELPQSFITQYQRALDDIHSSTGIYGTQVGQQGAELSGAAVDARTRQGSYVSYVVYDSLNRSIATGGRIINKMISRLYDTERDVTIEMNDVGLKKIRLNESDEYGNMIANNMKEGEFKIRLVPGPSYEGQQQQSIDSMNVVLQADKSGQIFPMIADLYIDQLTLNNKVEFKNRLRTIVPQEVIQSGKTGQPVPPKPPQPDPLMIAAEAKMLEAEVKKQRLMEEAEEYALEHELKMQNLETERLQAAAQLQGAQMRYVAETHKTNTDQHIAHAGNLIKILTHLKEPKEPKHTK